MTKPIPPIRKFMTTTPEVVTPEHTIAHAHEVMRRLHIRHLPVCQGSECVGVLSDGDLFKLEALTSADVSQSKVSSVMTTTPYAVTPDTPVDEVVGEMARRKLGSAVVIDNHLVVGLFTATDALSAFAELLRTRLHA